MEGRWRGKSEVDKAQVERSIEEGETELDGTNREDGVRREILMEEKVRVKLMECRCKARWRREKSKVKLIDFTGKAR